MAEVILIDSSSEEEDEEEEEKGKSTNILLMDNLRDRLKEHFSSLCPDDEEAVEEEDIIVQWRMKLNPFRTYGLQSSCFRTDKEMTSEKDSNAMASILEDKDTLEVASVDNGEKSITMPVSNDGLDTCKSKENDFPCSKKEILNTKEKEENTPCSPIKTDAQPIDESINSQNDRNIIQLEKTNKNSNSSFNLEENVSSTSTDDGVDLDTRLPYYLKNFMRIVKSVLKSDDMRLFNESEIKSLRQFQQITDTAKKLYIRLYQRKRDWFRCDKIHYPKIADDLTSAFKELVDLEYLASEVSLRDFDEICNLLTASDAQNLAKDIKLKVSNTKNNSKTDIVKLLKKHCTKQRTIFQTKGNSMKSILSKTAKKYIGKCVKLVEDQRFLFTRVILLFCLTTSDFTDGGHNNNAYGSNVLYQMLLSNLGDVEHPSFTVNKQYEIFPSRKHLIDYADVIEIENEFDMAVEKKDYTNAMKCYETVRPRLLSVLEELINGDEETHCLTLPVFLSRFSKHWVTLRLANKSVDILEKQRNYHEAVSLLELLLSQKFFCTSSRGYSWERLILDYERYIKDFEKAYLYTVDALKDPYLRTGHRLNILQRHQRLEKSSKVKGSMKKIDIKLFKEEISEPKEETIRANIFLESSAKNRAVFLSPAVGENFKLSNVEQHVITHYENMGFPSGKHGEGTTMTTLFVLIFCDIIFIDLPGVFQSEFQNSPLDLFYDSFYLNRKEKLNERINFVYHASEDSLRTTILNAWMSNYGTYCAGVSWELFSSETEAADLAVCLGNKVLGGICELFCKDLRRRMSGFPDLIVWNVEKKTCKIIEVKGPGDKLSVKQIVWLDVLSYLGADAFVCHVTGVGGKRKHSNVD